MKILLDIHDFHDMFAGWSFPRRTSSLRTPKALRGVSMRIMMGGFSLTTLLDHARPLDATVVEEAEAKA
jgi:hypothetical protein